MSRKVKSQLELYIEEVEGANEDVKAHEQETVQVPHRQTNWAHSLTAVTNGCIDDIAWIYCTISRATACVATIDAVEHCGKKPSICSTERRALLLFLTCVYLVWGIWHAISNIYGGNTLESSSIVGGITAAARNLLTRVLHTIFFWFLLITVAVPIIIAVLLYYLQHKYLKKLILCKHTAECIIGIIRRVQLVHMGGSISHPLPPVAKLEERLLCLHRRDNSAGLTNSDTESMLSCREMRRELGDALLATLKMRCDMCETVFLTQDLENMRTYCEQYEQTSIHSTPTLYQLERFLHLMFNTGSADTVHKYVGVELGNVQAAMYVLDADSLCNITTVSSRICIGDVVFAAITRYLSSMHRILQLLLQLCKLIYNLEKFTAKCHSISGNLTQSYKSPPPLDSKKLSTNAALETTSTIKCAGSSSSGSSFADQYLTSRLQLTKLRGAYEEVATRLWFAEQALSSTAALQYLLPDSCLVPAEPRRETGTSETEDGLQSLFAALASLSGTSCGTSSADKLTAGEVLHSVEAMVSSLPTHREFESLCESLLCLVAATKNGLTPVLLKHVLASTSQDHSAGTTTDTRLRDEDSGEASMNLGARNAGLHKNLFEDGETAPATGDMPHSNNVGNTGIDNDNIIDIFTTTVPARSVRKDKKSSAMEAMDAAAVQRERAHALLLLRELGQHMRRVQAVGTTEGGGGRTMERVRQIVADDNDGDVDAVGVRIETQLQPANLPEIGNEHHAAPQSQESDYEGDEKLGCIGEQEKMYRLGTVLLSADELRSLQTPRNNNTAHTGSTRYKTHESSADSKLTVQDSERRAIFSEMFKVNVAGGHGSAFGAALLGRRHEAAFGDDLSD